MTPVSANKLHQSVIFKADMARWQRTKQLDENADFLQERRSLKAIYKSLVAYLDRSALEWQGVEARLDFTQPEPLYNEIVIDGVTTYADQKLLDDCDDILMNNNTRTFSERSIAIVEMEIDHSEALGSYSYSISYMEDVESYPK